MCATKTTTLLLGPGGFGCFLGEWEDRRWDRDGRAVVERLNKLHAAVLAARHLLLAAKGPPESGPTSWDKPMEDWLALAEECGGGL